MKKYSNCIKLCATLLILVFIQGCYNKTIPIKQGYSLLIKSKKIKFNDIVLIGKNDNSLDVKAFTLGKSVANIYINEQHDICLNHLCYGAKDFNKDFFSSAYEDSFLNNVLRGKLLFKGKYKRRTQNGFTQNKGSIKYKKSNNYIYFKDKKRKIIIKLTKI